MATSPALYRKMPYKTLERLRVPGHDQRGADDADRPPDAAGQQLRRAGKWLEANKGKINLANAGLGAASHLCGLLFSRA
jgi:hypothetical protein